MTNTPSRAPEAPDLLKAAIDIISRRQLRPQYFDNGFFGEQSWELLLHLFVQPTGRTTIKDAAEAMKVSGATAMAMARVLIVQKFVTQSDSDGGWDEIPLSLTEEARQKLRGYLGQLIEQRLIAA